MRILHLRFAKAADEGIASWRSALISNSSYLTAIPLRLGSSMDVSLLAPDGHSFEGLLQELSRMGDGSCVQARQFEVPAEATIRQPVCIVAAPRSGSTMLYETLASCANAWTIGGESHAVIEQEQLRASDTRGHRLDASDANPKIRSTVIGSVLSVLRNRQERLLVEYADAERPASVKLLEKTPRNSLRVSFLHAIFPDCKFIFLYREPWSNISSLIDGWRAANRFRGYKVDGRPWKFLLPPDWRKLRDKSIPEIAAAQWRAANTYALDDLTRISRANWCFVDYQDLLTDTRREVDRLTRFASLNIDLTTEKLLSRSLPFSRTTLTPPQLDKWRRHEAELADIVPFLRDVVERVNQIRLESAAMISRFGTG
jgi:hypothetical protein